MLTRRRGGAESVSPPRSPRLRVRNSWMHDERGADEAAFAGTTTEEPPSPSRAFGATGRSGYSRQADLLTSRSTSAREMPMSFSI